MITPPATSPPAASPGKGRVFFTRLGSTLGLWALIATALALKLNWLLLALLILVGLLGTWEYFGLQSNDRGARPYATLCLGLCALYWAAIAYFTLRYASEPPWWLDAALLIAVVQGAFLQTFRTSLEGEQTLHRIFNSVFGVAYTTLLWSFFVRLLYFPHHQEGAMLILMVIMVTKFGDMGAYAIGSLIGKHKMIPHISPGKTWQGFGGALLGSYIAMAVMMSLLPGHLLPLTWGHALILAPLLSVVGVCGDLAESVLKRCHSIKDSGHKLPGIGGILDLTDSLLFTGPVAYFYLRAIS